nr:hypothetical protein [Enterobacter roggenkampii]
MVEAATVGELGICLRDKLSNDPNHIGAVHTYLTLPYSTRGIHTGSTVTQECVGVFYNIGSSHIEKGTPLPGSVCGIAPPPYGACRIPDSIELDHGILSPEDVNGNSVSTQFIIDCNMPLDAKIYVNMPENEYIPLGDSGIKSALKINQQSIVNGSGVAVNLSTGVNNINISSTLSATSNVIAGSYQGQSIIVLAVD